ncbi:DUF6194 family protein [Pendulispora albinea]|uniref:DUF6194 family protein n=1 Tax=Pendulispora albinea TaxID=2741071 RepID=A0ABZ2LM67_9BACT
MDQASITRYIVEAFAQVHTDTSTADTFFFYSSYRKLPFATLVTHDTDFDHASHLDRPDVFGLNVGIGRETFRSFFGPRRAGGGESPYDFTALDRVMPHPVYGAMHWVCVLNPSETTFRTVQPLLAEAYDRAVRMHARATITAQTPADADAPPTLQESASPPERAPKA